MVRTKPRHLYLVPPIVDEVEVEKKNAVLSDDGNYRYVLQRWWSEHEPQDLWIMLNPSTADANVDDPTINRCKSFTRRWGHGGIVVVNLYGWRATDPAFITWMQKQGREDEIVGPDNDMYIQAALAIIQPDAHVIVAWGNRAAPERAARVTEMIRAEGRTPMCLSTTGTGMPGHPLYLKGSSELQEWTGS